MNIIVKDKQFEPFITKDAIEKRVVQIAQQINEDYKHKKPLFLGILNGSFLFAADLFRHITLPNAEISFVKLASYKGTNSTGSVLTSIGLDMPLQGRDIIIIEDIIDTGNTLNSFLPDLYSRSISSLSIATLLCKPDALLHPAIKAQYCAFEIENKFVLGYGLDYDGLGRNLPEIYRLCGE